MKTIEFEWQQPNISGSGVVHLDATYFGRNSCVLIAIEAGTGKLLYMQHIGHEHTTDYKNAVISIENRGYEIRGIVVDGMRSLFIELNKYKIQMCQFHLVAIIRRKLTKNPQLTASKELLDLVYDLKNMTAEEFVAMFDKWNEKWEDFL